MRHAIAILAIAAALIGGARTGQAAISFDYDATCSELCSKIGLNAGDPVSGSISFDDAAVSPGAALVTADVLSFVLDIGSVEITSDTAVGFRFIGTLNDTATAFLTFNLRAGETVFPVLGDVAVVTTSFFFADPAGACLNSSCLSTTPGSDIPPLIMYP